MTETPALALDPAGDSLFLDVVHEPAKRLRPTTEQRQTRRLRGMLSSGALRNAALLLGTELRNSALLGAIGTGHGIGADRTYRTEVVDRLDDLTASPVDATGEVFHFVNEFTVAPGRREQMIEYFLHTIPAVRVQPGYISTNLIVNETGTRAVNIGQYETREDFVAIFRQRSVIQAFAAGPSYKVMHQPLGFLPAIPRLRLYGTPIPVAREAEQA